MLWPLPRLISRAVVSPREPLVNAWRYDYAWHQAKQGVFEREQFGIALVGFPLRAAGTPPLLTHNILLLLGFALSGYGAFVLAKLVTESWWAGLVSGIAFAFVPWRFAHLAETQHAWSGWIPLSAAALFAFVRQRTWGRGAILVAALLMAWLTWSGEQGRPLFPGFAPAILAAIGLIGPLGRDAKTRRFVLLGALVAIAFALTAPVVAYAGVALLAGIGAMKLIRHRHVVGALIAIVLLAELRPQIPRFHLIDTDEPPVHRWLAKSGRGGIFELPLRYDETLTEQLFRSTIHHRPLIREPKLMSMLLARPIDFSVLDRLAQSGVTTIVVHSDEIVGKEAALIRDFLFRAQDAGKLRFVARFDRGIEGDYVFELGRGGETRPFYGPQPLSRPAGFLDEPQEGAELRGLVRVSGWALAPQGIKRVRVWVDNHEEFFDAQLYPRLDVGALYPWHDASKAGFTVDIPRNKREGRIDVEVEVTDNRGQTVRLPQRWFVWSR